MKNIATKFVRNFCLVYFSCSDNKHVRCEHMHFSKKDLN